MRRKLIVLTVVMLAVLLLATPGLVAAKGGQPFFSLTGTITYLDGSIWVQVISGNRFVKPIPVDPLQVQVTGGTTMRTSKVLLLSTNSRDDLAFSRNAVSFRVPYSYTTTPMGWSSSEGFAQRPSSRVFSPAKYSPSFTDFAAGLPREQPQCADSRFDVPPPGSAPRHRQRC